MKKFSVLLVLIALTLGAYAQNDYGGTGTFSRVINGDGWLRPGGGGRYGGSSNGGGDIGDNILKIKLDGLLSSKIGLGYERVLNGKVTFGVDGLYQLPVNNTSFTADFGSAYDLVSGNISDEQDGFSNIFVPQNYGFQGSTISRFYVMPEVRYYFKEAPRGLYAGLYFKYRSLDYSNNLIYTDTFTTPGTPIDYDYDFNFKMNTASGGLSLGLQTFLLKRVSLDILFFGIQLSSNIGEIEVLTNATPLPADIQQDVQEGVTYINNNLPLVDNIFNLVENTPERILVESRFSSPSIRLPSIRLGIRF